MNAFVILQKIWLGRRMSFFKENNIAFRSLIPTQRFRVGLSCVLVWFGLAIAPSPEALAAVLPQPQMITVKTGGQLPNQLEIDLEAGAEKAEEASKSVFKGFEQTKEQIGKTQTRKQGMDRGRQKASTTLKALSDQAAEAPEKLKSTDKAFLKNLQGGNLDPETRTLK